MAGTVPASRPSAPAGGIAFARPVRSFDWQSAAALCNYDRGRGCVLVPSTLVLETIAAGTVTRTYRFRAKTNVYCTRRVWLLSLLGTTTSVTTISKEAGSAAPVTGNRISDFFRRLLNRFR